MPGLSDLQPGDHIRWLRGRHVGVVSEVLAVTPNSVRLTNQRGGSMGGRRRGKTVQTVPRTYAELHAEHLP